MVRRYDRGARPGPGIEEEKSSKWILRRRQPKEMEKRQILSEVYKGAWQVYTNALWASRCTPGQYG